MASRSTTSRGSDAQINCFTAAETSPTVITATSRIGVGHKSFASERDAAVFHLYATRMDYACLAEFLGCSGTGGRPFGAGRFFCCSQIAARCVRLVAGAGVPHLLHSLHDLFQVVAGRVLQRRE